MTNCPSCQAEVADASRRAGRCAECGAVLRTVPQRTVADLRELIEEQQRGEATIELDPGDTAENSGGSETLVGPPPEEPESKPATIALAGEGTIDFDSVETFGGDGDVDDSMSTSHWEGNIEGDATDPNATIKAKETVGGSFITKSSLVVKPRRVQEQKSLPVPSMSPDDAPDYELIDVIGEGGMGVVYAAKQSSIARTVAVKMLKGHERVTNEHREKFISEAVVTGELDHPNIVPIYDLGANDKGALFYSMKRVRGTPWNKVVRKKSLDENLSILLRVADAVAFAHKNGVIHRDLKPENTMLGDFGEVLVMDWGLARISPEFPNAESVSQSDAMGGTPAYMAPEMATGPIDAITTASDVYLLGAILYEIVAGHPPHKGKSVMACLYNAAKNEIAPTRQTGELVDVARRAMASDPEDRYATVQEFQAAIREYQAHSESILLTDSASDHLANARETSDYDLYARSVFGLEEAVAMWTGNERALELLNRARIEYATTALDNGDLDLAASLLDSEISDHEPVLAAIESARRERHSRQRRLQWLKRTVAALLLAVAAIISYSYMRVSAERDRAVKAEGEAQENYRQAELARQDAVAQRDRAVKAEGEATANFEAAEVNRKDAEQQRDRAEEQKQIAETERARAVEQEQEARRQEQLAQQAKQAEEYAAYVARIGLAHEKIEENAFDRALELLDQCNPKLRNWEWGRLRQLCSLSEQTWDLGAPVDAVAVSPDGRLFATADWQGRANVYDVRTGRLAHSFEHQQAVHAVAFDPGGTFLATGCSDHAINIYRLADGQQVKRFTGHSDAVVTVRFSSDGQRLLSGGYDNTARLWDVAESETIQVLRRHNWWVWSAEFSSDDQRIVTVGQDGKAVVWQQDGDRGFTLQTEFAKHRGPIYAARFAPDDSRVVTVGYDGRVLLWNPDAVEPVDIEGRLDGRADPPAPYVELLGHRGPVRAVEFSQDGATLATGGQDNLIILWDLASGEIRRTLRGHASHVRGLALSADGASLLSASRDQLVKSWRPATYAEVRALPAADDSVLAAKFSNDGELVVTANRDRTAALWDVESLTQRAEFAEGHEFLASSAAFFANGSRLATAAGDGTARVWEVATGAEIFVLDDAGQTGTLAVDDDGQFVATGGDANEVNLWLAKQGEHVGALAGHQAEVTAAAFAPGGKMLATGDDRGECRIWRYDDGEKAWEEQSVLQGHSRTITAMRFTDNGARLITASGDTTCGQWDVAAGEELIGRELQHPAWVADVAISRDGRRAVSCCDDGKLRVWSLADATLEMTLTPQDGEGALTSVDMSPDGSRAVSVSAVAGTVRIWNLETGQEITENDQRGSQQSWLDVTLNRGLIWAARFAPDGNAVLTIGGNDARLVDIQSREAQVRFSPHGAVASVDIAPDGQRVATGSWDRSAKIWDVKQGRAVLKLDGVHRGPINAVRFSPRGGLLLTASDDGTARLWDAQTGQLTGKSLTGHGTRVRAANFSPDGMRIVTAGGDKTARIWDVESQRELVRLDGHQWAVRCAQFSPDGALVITGSEDNTARVWDSATGEQVTRLSGHTGAVASAALSLDGTRAVTGSVDNTVKLWDAQTGKEVLTLAGHDEAVTSVSFSPDGLSILSSGRDGRTLLWPAVDWSPPIEQARLP